MKCLMKRHVLVLEGDKGDPPEAASAEEHLGLKVVRREPLVYGLPNEPCYSKSKCENGLPA